MPIWRDFNRLIANDVKHFNYDSNLHEVTIDGRTGIPCAPDNPNALIILMP